MAKAVALYTGSNSCGTSIEVAKDINGQWWGRELCFNGYGVSWSKWTKESELSHPDKVLNQCEYGDAPEYKDIPEEKRHLRVTYGFKTLYLNENAHKHIRLPNK